MSLIRQKASKGRAGNRAGLPGPVGSVVIVKRFGSSLRGGAVNIA
jgi:hypothetical protein